MKINDFQTKDGKKVALYLWDEVESPRAVLQLVHGMCEHLARYEEFAAFCNNNGIIVLGNDLRGHGKSTTPQCYGYEEGDMWGNNCQDVTDISNWAKEQYKLPLILMGHSYGSFLTQRQLQINPYPDAFILSGSNMMKGLLYTLGAMISKLQCNNKGGDKPCDVMAKMSFSAYEKRFPGLNSWLSVNKENVEKYNADPACGYIASNNFYFTFMKGLAPLYRAQEAEKIDLNKPLYLFAGGDDPVGEYGKGVMKLYNWYKKIGVKDVAVKLYDGYRHEMLNEDIKEQVYADVMAFINKVLAK